MNIIESIHLTDPVIVTRSWRERLLALPWRERLLALPWRPLQRTKVVQVPSKKVFMADGGVLCHPQTARALRSYFPNS